MRFEVHIESTIQKFLYDPVVRAFHSVAERVRVLQPGSLHLYLSYIFLTLLAGLLAYAWSWGQWYAPPLIIVGLPMIWVLLSNHARRKLQHAQQLS